jgi:hypothetical protein
VVEESDPNTRARPKQKSTAAGTLNKAERIKIVQKAAAPAKSQRQVSRGSAKTRSAGKGKARAKSEEEYDEEEEDDEEEEEKGKEEEEDKEEDDVDEDVAEMSEGGARKSSRVRIPVNYCALAHSLTGITDREAVAKGEGFRDDASKVEGGGEEIEGQDAVRARRSAKDLR